MDDKNQVMSQEDSRRLRALFEMATDGIITIGTDGVVENLNRAACELFGYKAEEVIGQKINMLMAAHDRKHHDEYLDRYHTTQKPHIIGIGREVMGRRKDGKEFPIRLAVSEVKLEDKVIYTGILHDVSQFHEAQRRVEQLNEELENKVRQRTAALEEREIELKHALGKERELNELKSRFLSMASHEFKTPLSTVLSSAELIELYETEEQQPKRERHINRIKDAVNQLTEVLNDFLSLSQLEQGKVGVRKRLVDLRALISTSVESSEGQMKTGQQVIIDHPEEPLRIISDPKLLRHILVNLISNAAKYSPEGMDITIKSWVSKDECKISVIDQGIGIPLEDHPHLFDRFFRARNVENIKGTGLGLNIVSHYVNILDGHIDFSSEMGKGSEFTIVLPANQPN
ncbi:PAS domain-containing sensor histidine kinase [Neolewinella persica]|uniref:PAS domain-containing sensor histidine kinase n=1 Tax=Neolewinella persica TaxID=70998 RepID=UPI00036034E8|nr:PAS domain-containing sensor histidine kinase [Neolewinella persica]